MDKFTEILRSITLGIVQGLTEFLPVSSSFHLRFVPSILGWPEIGLAFSAFLHLGTLLAIFIYFGKDLYSLTVNSYREAFLPDFSIVRLCNTLGFKILIGTIPAVAIGFIFHDQIEMLDKNQILTSCCLIGVALLLWFIDAQPIKKENLQENISKREAVAIGIGQACALIPGVSRSGATIGVGRTLGYSREEAARFSFLLGTPVILGAGLLEILKVMKHSVQLEVGIGTCLIGCLAAAITGYFVIGFFLKILQNTSLLPFIIYRIVIGSIGLFMVLKGWIR